MLISNFRDEHRGLSSASEVGISSSDTCPHFDCEFCYVFYLVYEKKQMAEEILTELSVLIPLTALTELEEFVVHKGGRLLINAGTLTLCAEYDFPCDYFSATFR